MLRSLGEKNVPKFSKQNFFRISRENGRVGVRNHVIILPVDDRANAACEAVAHNIKGVMVLPHPYGRLFANTSRPNTSPQSGVTP
jgi:altronate dehydratase